MDEAGLLQVSLPVEQKQQRPHEHRGAYRDQVLPDPVRLLGIVLGKQHVCRRQAGFATLTSISPAKLSLRRRRKERPPSSIAQRTARRRPQYCSSSHSQANALPVPKWSDSSLACTTSSPSFSHSRRTSSRLSVVKAGVLRLVALTSIIGAPWIGKSAQGFEEDNEVGLLSRREVERLRGPPVLRVQAGGIETGVVAHDLREGVDAAVAAIGSGQYQIAQGRHLELAEARLLER